MEDKYLTEQEGLEIISQMIRKTRKNIVDGNVFIHIGLALAAWCLVCGILLMWQEWEWLSYASTALILLWNLCAMQMIRKAICKEGKPLTYTDNMLKATWDMTTTVGMMVAGGFLVYAIFPGNTVLEMMWIVPFSELLLLILACGISCEVFKIKTSTRLTGLFPFFGAFLLNYEDDGCLVDMGGTLLCLMFAGLFHMMLLGTKLNDKGASMKRNAR